MQWGICRGSFVQICLYRTWEFEFFFLLLFGISLQSMVTPLNSATGCLDKGKILDLDLDCLLLKHGSM